MKNEVNMKTYIDIQIIPHLFAPLFKTKTKNIIFENKKSGAKTYKSLSK